MSSMQTNDVDPAIIDSVKSLRPEGKATVLNLLLQTFDRDRLCELLAPYSGTPPSSGQCAVLLPPEPKQYPDSRARLPPHSAVIFTSKLDRQIAARALIVELLGAEAAVFFTDWGSRVDFNVNAPQTNQVILFTESNSQPRNRDYFRKSSIFQRGDATTQEEEFKAAGLEFADDIQLSIVCATLFRRAKDIGLDLRLPPATWKDQQSGALSNLNEYEIDFLTKLASDGNAIRSSSGALSIIGGSLRVLHFFYDYSYPGHWAAGKVPS